MGPFGISTELHTTHLEHSNHSLGYVTGLKYIDLYALAGDHKALCYYYGGIPYALPPVGPYRFKKPRSLPACYRYGTKANPGSFTGGAGLCPQPGYMKPTDTKNWDEDCLQLNIWKPAGEPPKGDGGWLQFGTPNSNNLTSLLGNTAGQFIFVLPAYRLNVFGFIASRELEEESGYAGNYGFWDQRLALDWTRRRIAYFGGDPTNITVAGYSAGSHSVFHQLSHDIALPRHQRLIKRAIMFSNGSGLQPKTMPVAQVQFDAFLTALGIPLSLSSAAKLERLRAVPANDLVQAAAEIDLHEFRTTTDGAFVRRELFDEIDNGIYAARMKEGGTELLIGECQDEHFVYGSWRPPKENTYAAFRKRLCADYPPRPLDAVLKEVFCPTQELPVVEGVKSEDWSEAFGRVYAQFQVHALERGFIAKMVEHGAGDLIKRYRIEWRAQCVDASFPKEWGVTHGTDMALWFYGNGIGGNGVQYGLTKEESELALMWLRPFWSWLRGDGIKGWGTANAKEVRRLKSDGTIDIWQDQYWENGLKFCKIVREAQREQQRASAKL